MAREGNGTPLQYYCLENPMDGGAWWATVHGVVKSRTRLSHFTFTFHFHALEKEMATHSSVLAWRSPGTGEPDGLPSMGSHRVGHDWMISQCSPGLLSLFRIPKMLQRASFSSADGFIYCQYLISKLTFLFTRNKSFGGLWKLSIRKILPSSTRLHPQVPNKITSLTFTRIRSRNVCDSEKGPKRVGAGCLAPLDSS